MNISRRAALSRLGVLALSATSACTPVRLVLGTYPRPEASGEESTDAILHAFARTIAPGLADDPGFTRVYADPFYRFARYREFFAGDLRRRAEQGWGRGFTSLGQAERVVIISEGLDGGAVTRRLYTGAVFLTQVVAFSQAWSDGGRPAALGFDGAPLPPSRAAITYPEPARFLAEPLTTDGNPA